MTSANVIIYRIEDLNGKEVGTHRQHLLCKTHWGDLLKFIPPEKFTITSCGLDENEAEWENDPINLKIFLDKLIKVEHPKSENNNIMNMEKTYKLYILIRNDLDCLNPGKAMAQAAHASNQFIYEHGSKPEVKKWQLEGVGFGTTIVLSTTQLEIDNAIKLSNLYQVPSGFVIDRTYPFIVHKEIEVLIPLSIQSAPPIFKDDGNVIMFRRELTCGYVFVSDGSDAQNNIVGRMFLHP